MKSLGITLLVIGLILGIFGFYQSSQDQTLLEIGDIEVQKGGFQMNWMIIVGGIMFIVGLIMTAVQRR
jgi:hypothetical protein